MPTGFLPEEDQGYLYLNVQLPFAASIERTDAVCRQVEDILKSTPGVKYYNTIAGFSLLSFVRNTYSAFFWISLKEWGERTHPQEQFDAIKAHLNRELARLPQANTFAFSPPAIQGVGTAGGFTFVLEDRAGKDIPFLSENLNKFLEAARKRPELTGLSTTFLPVVPQVLADVDRDKVLKQGVDLGEVYKTLQTFMGGSFINYFNRFGRQWQVYVQAEGQYRTRAENLGLFYVRNKTGEPVPLSALTTIKQISGPEFTMRYNLYRSAQINGSAAPGYSSAQAMKVLEDVFAQTMPAEMGYDYLGMSFQEKKAQQGVPPAGNAHRSVRRVCGPIGPADGQQRLCPDRAGHAHWPGSQERYSDCRVRATGIRKRQIAYRRRPDRGADSSEADSDDVFCVRIWLRAALDRDRGRRGGTPRSWHRRHRRHAGRHLPGRLPHSRDVLRGRKAGEPREKSGAHWHGLAA